MFLKMGLFKVKLLVLLLTLIGCNESSRNPINMFSSKTSKHIFILPLGKIDANAVDVINDSLQKRFSKVTVLPREAFPMMAFNKHRNRYRADSLLKWMRKRVGKNETYVGITTEDISVTKGAIADFGVMGLGYQPGTSCIASSYRLKNKKAFFKLVIHELGHTTGLPHCPTKYCYMRDANGSDITKSLVDFCGRCKKHLLDKGWRI